MTDTIKQPQTRRTEDSPLQRNMASLRTVMESLVVIGICWLVATSTQQGKDLAEIKATNQYVTDMAKKVPDIEARLAGYDVRIGKNEQQIRDLQTLQVKGAR